MSLNVNEMELKDPAQRTWLEQNEGGGSDGGAGGGVWSFKKKKNVKATTNFLCGNINI